MDAKIRPLYMLSTKDPPQNKGHIQTESEGLEKDIPRKFSSNTGIYEPTQEHSPELQYTGCPKSLQTH